MSEGKKDPKVEAKPTKDSTSDKPSTEKTKAAKEVKTTVDTAGKADAAAKDAEKAEVALNKAIEKAAVYRYGHLCYTIHRTYKSNNIPVPKEHLKRVEKAVSLLEPIATDPKNRKMQA